MSNNTEDEFEPIRPDEQGDEAQVIDPTLLTSEGASATPSPEDMVPPEARGEANGGPLGCCLGVTVGMFLSLTLAVLSRFYGDPLSALFQHNYAALGLVVRILMGILIVVLAIVCGRLGWKLGKRFYREYEPPVVKERVRRSKPRKIR
jgi:hypothetical protein